jgi:hypothetical protein
MEKTMRFMNSKWIYLILLAGMAACGGARESYDVRPESFNWISEDSLGAGFMMRDDNAITQSFRCNYLTSGYDYSTSSFLVFRTRTTRKQNLYQEWGSSYGRFFSISLTAEPEPFGDNLTITLNDVSFTYDLGKKEVTRLTTPHGLLSKTISGDGYVENDPLLSEVEILESMYVGQVFYSGVMHFTLKDFESKWGPYTITEIFVAKYIGLVKFTLSNGLTYNRI